MHCFSNCKLYPGWNVFEFDQGLYCCRLDGSLKHTKFPLKLNTPFKTHPHGVKMAANNQPTMLCSLHRHKRGIWQRINQSHCLICFVWYATQTSWNIFHYVNMQGEKMYPNLLHVTREFYSLKVIRWNLYALFSHAKKSYTANQNSVHCCFTCGSITNQR